jgi:acyl-CoA thioester hydrolase
MSSRFIYELQIQKRFADFDMLRHVNNTTYPQYVETGRLGYFRDFLNFDITKHLAVTVQFEIEYVRAAEFSDNLSVLLKTKSIGNTSIVIEYEVVNSENRATVYARGSVKQVTCDARTGKPTRLPDSNRRVIIEKEGFPIEEAHLE